MRLVTISVLIAALVAACAPSDTESVQAPTTTLAASASSVGTPSTTTTSPGGTLDVPPQLVDSELRLVKVGDRELLLAIADSPGLRTIGLMGVEDLGDLDGMLFYWRHEAHSGFWMKDTLIPLDIVWFDVDGAMVGRTSMVPCVTETCPRYEPEGDVDYRYAIEANPGDLDWVTESTRITYSD